MKKSNKQRGARFVAFHFWDLKMVPIDLALNFASGNLTYFFPKIWACYLKDYPNIEI